MAGTAFFRCDATSKIGSGHVMRCLTMANLLRRYGWNCTFISAPESIDTVPALRQSGYRVLNPQEVLSLSADILIVDHYGLSKNDEAQFRGLAGKIIVIDDLADREHDCDMLIDQTYGRRAEDYKDLVPSHCLLLTGSDYALLRPEFAQARPAALKQREEKGGKIETVLIGFGGTDPDNSTMLAVQALQNHGLALDVITSSGNRNILSLQEAISQTGNPRISLHIDSGKIEQLMAQSDFCVGAGGTTSWERCCMALPSLVIKTADNQTEVIKNLLQADAIFVLPGDGTIKSAEQLSAAFDSIRQNPRDIIRKQKNSAALCDGRGALRSFIGISRILGEHGVSFRLMKQCDQDMLLEWQNIPGIRKFSRNPNPPTPDEHRSWFKNHLEKEHHLCLIVNHQAKAAGLLQLVRNPEDQDSYEISILIHPGFQGKSVGTGSLAMLGQLFPGLTFTAEVREDNAPSTKLFKKAGFSQVSGNFWVRPPAA